MKAVVLPLIFLLSPLSLSAEGPIRILFLGHDQEHHNSNRYFPMLAQALGREAIYFDYVTEVEAALGQADFLNRFDALLLYANHATIEPHQWRNLKRFVERGGGFLPIHCASWCFQNEPEFDQLVGARFAHHKTGVFTPETLTGDHPVSENLPALTAWDETYVHKNHNLLSRRVLQVREPGLDDNITEPEPWTWVRQQGKGRIFYTASGHDERVWNHPSFHELLKRGILWAIGDVRRSAWEEFVRQRPQLKYEVRDNIPNYERRPEPLPYQLPLPPEASLQYTRTPIDFRLELFASEPDIVNPICLAWDERGRLWVAETIDYPNELTADRQGRDRIKILEDTNGDGRCDKVTIFADRLNVPTSLTFANRGVIVAHAPDFLFLQDTDGDDRADKRRVLNTGWGVNDTHAGPSNLRYGFDNRIWGAVGYSGYRGERNGKTARFSSGIFRMNPDGSEVTLLHQFNNNTWGLGFNEDGDVFGSTANNNPAFFCGFPADVAASRSTSARMIASNPVFHPITPNVRQVDAFGHYTAAAGYVLATSDNFPESWRNRRAFVSGPTGHLLGMYDTRPDGSGYAAENAFALVASADEWFSPVAAEVGPDGHLWIADWYNFIIQHNPTPNPLRGGYAARNGRGNAHINPNRDRQHGRIYRLVWDGAQPASILSLAHAPALELVEALESDNLFWRLTAQRLLVEKKPSEAVEPLRKLVQLGSTASIHALRTLQGMQQLDTPTHLAALLSKNSALKKNAIDALGNDEAAVQLFFDAAVVADSDPQVRRVAFTKMARFPASDLVRRAVIQLQKTQANREDTWLAAALKTTAEHQGVQESRHVKRLGKNLIQNPGFEAGGNNDLTGWRHANYNTAQVEYSVETEAGHVRSGRRAARIRSTGGADSGWATTVAVKPDTHYQLGGWIRTRDVQGAMGALFNVHAMGKTVTRALQKDQDWTEVKVNFNSKGQKEIVINALFGGWGRSTGTAWFDDVSLREVVYEDATDAEIGNIVGNAARGKEIYHKHQVASCVRCHQLAGQGGVVGPALDKIASRKGAAYIRESLVDPQARIAEGYPVPVSPMPPFGVLLTAQELEDLMAYLLTLK